MYNKNDIKEFFGLLHTYYIYYVHYICVSSV